MKSLIFLCFSTFLVFQSFAFRVRDINFQVDSSKFGFSNKMVIHVFLINKRGVSYELDPLFDNRYWRRIKVSGNFVTSFEKGVLTFDQTKVTYKNNRMDLTVSYDTITSISKVIILPHVKELRVLSDSLFVNSNSSLKFHLLFSNNATLPLKSNLYDFRNVYCKTNVGGHFTIQNDFFRLNLLEPTDADSIQIEFRERGTEYLLCEKWMKVCYKNSIEINGTGRNGQDGTPGMQGTANYKTGANGGDGSDGQNGLNLTVLVKKSVLKKATIIDVHSFFSDGSYQHDMIDFKGNPIKIMLNGGAGGNGGFGGSGFDGVVDTTKKINEPYGGNGGVGGKAGNGGNGGNLTLIFEQETGDLTSYFLIENQGGKDGLPGGAGARGSGGYQRLGLINLIFDPNKGKSGVTGVSAFSGKSGTMKPPQLLPNTAWNKLLQEYLAK